MNSMSEMRVNLGFLVRGLLAVRRVGREDADDLVEESIDDARDSIYGRWDAELGLLVNLDHGGSRISDGIHELEKALDKLKE